MYTANVPPPQVDGATAINDREVFTVNVQPAGSVTIKLLCCTGKKKGDGAPPHMESVG